MSKSSFGARFLGRMANLGPKRLPSTNDSHHTSIMNLDDYLAQSEDLKIASKLKRLQLFIESHTEYYHIDPAEMSKEEVLTLLQKTLFTSDEAATRRLACSLYNGAHRPTLISMVISNANSMGIYFHGNEKTSLLPSEIVLFMKAFRDIPRSLETSNGIPLPL